jgi:hypothetical protein
VGDVVITLTHTLKILLSSMIINSTSQLSSEPVKWVFVKDAKTHKDSQIGNWYYQYIELGELILQRSTKTQNG